MAKKRTNAKIELDCAEIRKVAETAASWDEIAQETSLTNAQISISLNGHPRIKKQIEKMMAANKAKKMAEQQVLETRVQLEKETAAIKAGAEKEALAIEKTAEREATATIERAKQEAAVIISNASKDAFNIAKEAKCTALQLIDNAKVQSEQIINVAKSKSEKSKKETVQIVLDSSIAMSANLQNLLNGICETGAKIVLTNITIKELRKLSSQNVVGAIEILGRAENDESFCYVFIDKKGENSKECIIKYCVANKNRVTLITADSEMAQKARRFGVEIVYNEKAYLVAKRTRVVTLYDAFRIGGKLIINAFQNEEKNILVISNGVECHGEINLNIGDDVYIAKNNMESVGYISFAHYKIISLGSENNCKLIFYKQMRDLDSIKDLPDSNYKSFLRDYKSFLRNLN